MFLGTTFFSGKYSLFPSPASSKTAKSISISNGVYDHLFASKNPELSLKDIYSDWDYDTLLNADFNGDYDGGNSGFSLKNTDTILIKIRKRGTIDWRTIYTVPIKTIDDFDFTKNYPYAAALTDYDLMISSTVNGVENSYVITEVSSDFDGMFIVDKDNIYGTAFDVEGFDTTRNTDSTLITMLNSKYPSVFENSDTNYDSGSASGTFLRFDQDDCTINLSKAAGYRKDILNWLTNKKPKILKLYDGRIWLVKIVNSPTDTKREHPDLHTISFDWVEIGDADDNKKLYQCGLSDVPGEYL